MSEYAGQRKQPRLEDLDNRGTLFEEEPAVTALEELVDTQHIPYGEARARLGTPTDDIQPQNGPHVSLADHYREELLLLDLTAANSMRAGLQASLHKDAIVERYGGDLPQVVEGAQRNMRINNQMIHSMYRADELKKVGFSEHDVEDDVTLMRMEHRERYAGPEHASDRAKRRRHLKKKLSQLGIDHAA
jgi:hypothetical protein